MVHAKMWEKENVDKRAKLCSDKPIQKLMNLPDQNY